MHVSGCNDNQLSLVIPPNLAASCPTTNLHKIEEGEWNITPISRFEEIHDHIEFLHWQFSFREDTIFCSEQT
jgi:hypothetical protein